MSGATIPEPRATPVSETLRVDRVIARVLEGVVHVEAGDGERRGDARATHSGAGVLWARDADGRALIVSNAHVVTREPIWLSGQNGSRHPATLLARDAARDLALILCDDAPSAWRAVPATDRALRAGQVVMAVGHPLGLRHAVSTGVVHAVGPLQSDVLLPEPQRSLPWAQLDLQLAPGNSGGPVIDATGHLVGISTMIIRGLGLAIPADDVDRFVLNARGPSHLMHGWTRDA